MNIKKILVSSAAAAIIFGSVAVSALAVGTNGSFELGTDPGSFTPITSPNNSAITDWNVNSGSVDYIGTYWTASNGSRSIDLSGNEAGSIQQTITTISGHTYKVTFDMAGNTDGGPTVKTMNVDAGGAPTAYSFDTTGKTKAAMGWVSKTFNFTATGASTVITFTSTTSTAYGPALDNVVIEDTTPVQPIPAQCDQTLTYNVIVGTDGSEVLNGTAGNDLILAKGGSDLVDGKGGNDCIDGGAGSNQLIGGTGNDVIIGGDSSDSIEGNDGNDKLYGNGGSDSLDGGNGLDQIWGGASSDSLFGGADNDMLDGQAGMDFANGGAGAGDTCVAEAKASCEL